MENTNINIPVTTVDSFVETMTRLYAKAINAGVSLRMIPAPFLWGAPGVGKSDGVRQLADNLSEQTGKRVIVTDASSPTGSDRVSSIWTTRMTV